ncbi:hypothetical protein ACFWFB_32935 [Streptomyces albidoflavus]
MLTAVCLLAWALSAATPAHASAGGLLDVTCTPPSSTVSTYTPPLTNTPQISRSTISRQFGPCVSLSHPEVTSGTSSSVNAPRERSCLDLLGSGSSTITITWNTGQTSTLSTNFTSTVAGAVVEAVGSGTVTSGLFQGDTVVMDMTGPATDILLCTAGLGTVSSVYSTMVLELTSV